LRKIYHSSHHHVWRNSQPCNDSIVTRGACKNYPSYTIPAININLPAYSLFASFMKIDKPCARNGWSFIIFLIYRPKLSTHLMLNLLPWFSAIKTNCAVFP
jgi:hypothetical protein